MPAPERVRRTPRRLARERTAEALVARRWLLSLLASGAGLELSPPPILHGESWRLALSVEGAGLPALRALQARGAVEGLPAELMAAVESVATDELQRVLMARAQLLQLDAVAVELGATPVVIKGGAVAMSAEPLDLGDLDVLLPSREEAARFAAGLGRAGYAIRYPDEWRQGDRHLVRHWPGGLSVELHARADYGPPLSDADTTALPGLRALRRSAAAVEVARVLRHGVVEHAYRRGHLRDVVLLAQAASRLGTDELGRMHASLAGEACAAEQGAMLALAGAVAAGRGLDAGGDRFARVSALRYELRQRPPGGRERVPLYFLAVQRSAGEARPWLRWAFGQVIQPIEPTSRWQLGAVRRVSPLAGRVLGQAGRAAYRAGVLGVGGLAAVAARWRAGRRVRAAG